MWLGNHMWSYQNVRYEILTVQSMDVDKMLDRNSQIYANWELLVMKILICMSRAKNQYGPNNFKSVITFKFCLKNSSWILKEKYVICIKLRSIFKILKGFLIHWEKHIMNIYIDVESL